MPTFTNPFQYGSQEFEWDPGQQVFSSGIQENAPAYLTELLAYRDRQRQGQTQPWEAEQYTRWEEQARAIPTRDIASLTSGWQGESQGQWTDEGWREGAQDWWTRLDPGSPDAGGVMLSIRDKMDAGTASKQERELYGKTLAMAQDWNYRASVPQASDANPFGLGDQLFGALMTLGMGTTGGLAAAPLAAGGAGLTTTLGSLGTLAGIGGTAAGALGQEMDVDWLKRLGVGLGAAGGIAGGIGGLANVANRGITSLGDAARLASNAGRVVGGVGASADNDALKQAGGWLGTAGQLGGGVENLMHLVSGTGGSLQGVAGLVSPLRKLAGQFMQPGGSAAPQQRPTAMARPVTAAPQQPLYGTPAVQASPATGGAGGGTGSIQALLQAAQQAQRQGLSRQVQPSMSNQDWLRWNWQAPQSAPQSTLWNL